MKNWYQYATIIGYNRSGEQANSSNINNNSPQDVWNTYQLGKHIV